jgi:hypothetical protein
LDNMNSSMKCALDSIAKVLHVDDVRFNPITLIRGSKRVGGAVIVCIGL